MADRRGPTTVLGYFYALIVVLAAAAIVLLALVLLRDRIEDREREHLEQYHLRTLTLATEVSSRVGIARELAAMLDEDAIAEISPGERELTGEILAVSEGIREIASLQAEIGDDTFEGTVARAREQAEAMRLAALVQAWTPARWESELAAMNLTVFQLSRLHSIAVEDELDALSRRNDQIRIVTIVVTVGVVAGSALLIARLIRLVRRRLQELDEANSALLEARERLQQSQRLDALSTLVGGVAHDFNNLLSTILGYSELALLDIDPDEPGYERLRTIQSAGERASGLTKQLLAFSRQETGQPEPTDLNFLVRDLEPVIRGLTRNGIELEIRYEPSLPPVLVDPVQMEQVLLNVVVNARDAMSGGGSLSVITGVVDVGGREDRPRASYVRLRVEDTGSGMPPEVATRAYEPFFTTKGREQGTGLGLSVVHGIVSASGGFIELDSQPGIGTRVDIHFPSMTASDPQPGDNQPAPSNRGSEVILLVEDEQQIRQLLTTALEGVGYHVVAVEDGDQALSTMRGRREPVDLVLTDVVMPGIRGPELVAQLRAAGFEFVAVFISGYGEGGVLEGLRDSGDGFVAKPFKLRELTAVIREQLDRDRARETRNAGVPDTSVGP